MRRSCSSSMENFWYRSPSGGFTVTKGCLLIRHAIPWWCHARVLTRLLTTHRLRLCCYSEPYDDAPHAQQRGCWAAGCFRVLLTRQGGNREGIERDLNGALGQVTRVSQPTRWMVLNRVSSAPTLYKCKNPDLP
jgi:hypothetical protein